MKTMENIEVMEKPYTMEEIREKADEDGWISGYIAIELSDAIDNDLEGFLDLMGEMLVGNCCMQQPDYTPIGVTKEGLIVLKVSGDISFILEDEDEDEDYYDDDCDDDYEE